jgi:hypothetical protein
MMRRYYMNTMTGPDTSVSITSRRRLMMDATNFNIAMSALAGLIRQTSSDSKVGLKLLAEIAGETDKMNRLASLVVGPDGEEGELVRAYKYALPYCLHKLHQDGERGEGRNARAKILELEAALAHAREVAQGGGARLSIVTESDFQHLNKLICSQQTQPTSAGGAAHESVDRCDKTPLSAPPADPVDAVIEALNSAKRTPSDFTLKVEVYEAGTNLGLEIAILYLDRHREELRGDAALLTRITELEGEVQSLIWVRGALEKDHDLWGRLLAQHLERIAELEGLVRELVARPDGVSSEGSDIDGFGITDY